MSEMPKALYLEGTDETPSIMLDAEKNLFSIEGRCIPEDGIEFFAPVMTWLRVYSKSPNPKTNVEIKLSYFNSASSKAMWEFFSMLRRISATQTQVEWHYSDDDDEMRDAGEEFASFFNLPFNYIAYHEEIDEDDFPF